MPQERLKKQYEKLEYIQETLQQVGNGFVDLEHVEQSLEYTADLMFRYVPSTRNIIDYKG